MNVDVYQMRGTGNYIFVPHGKKPADIEGVPSGTLQFFKAIDLSASGPRIALDRDDAIAELNIKGWYATSPGFAFTEDIG